MRLNAIFLCARYVVMVCAALEGVMLGGCGKVYTSNVMTPETVASSCTQQVYFLPKSFFKVSIHPRFEKGALVYSSSLPNLVPMHDMTVEKILVADTDNPICLDFLHDATSSDKVDITIGSNGLLQSVNSTVEDKKGEILVATVDLVAQIAKLGTVPHDLFKMLAILDNGPKPAIQPLLIHIEEVYSYADLIKDNGVNVLEGKKYPKKMEVRLQLKSLGGEKPYPKADLPTNSKKRDGPSFYYKVLIPHKVLLSWDQHVFSDVFNLPDNGPTLAYDVSRAALVKKTTKLTFTDGALTKVEIDNPSEALAAVKLPVDILKAIVSIPGELLTFKVQNIKDQTAVSDAELERLKAKTKLLEYQQGLAE